MIAKSVITAESEELAIILKSNMIASSSDSAVITDIVHLTNVDVVVYVIISHKTVVNLSGGLYQ